jgi:hypothetical protein
MLLIVAGINVIHNSLAIATIYSNLFFVNSFSLQLLWLLQAISASGIRIVELWINYQIIGGLGSDFEKYMLLTLTILGSVGVLFGRLFDVYVQFSQNGARLGMIIVSGSCLLPSLAGLIILRKTIFNIKSKYGKSLVFQVVSNTAFRMAFIQMIDLGLIIVFLLGRSNVIVLFFLSCFEALDNGRALLLLMDLLVSRIQKELLVDEYQTKTDDEDITSSMQMPNLTVDWELRSKNIQDHTVDWSIDDHGDSTV